ncbi:glutamate--cysteine ligase [Gilvimarinus sp. F26214L]|uniref:glutamate--cysteine ligase n=1 Tax=Gilvimarinus sp. DZF01 TaxID=3461371 RepID=UPI0040460687
MGTAIDRISFEEEDYRRFSARLRDNLNALRKLLATPGFGDGPPSFGAELELYIIDELGRPLLINQEIQAEMRDAQLTLELNRYNLEYNFKPVLARDHCFAQTQSEALASLEALRACAQKWHGDTVAIGILPTLQQSDTGYHAMTKTPRYEALTRELRKIRGGPFHIDIKGEEPILLEMEDVTLEGANTSFQAHWRISVREFANTYNALQLVTPLVLAIAANSPTLFGHRLWQETRIPLFKQSIDCRPVDPLHPRPARVNYGHSWLRHGAVELFAECVYLYRPVLPVLGEEDPLDVLKAGGIPQLSELRLQQGSVWLWNRPVYDPADHGHLRIEMRALPAGPSVVDMLANAALLIGLGKLMQKKINRLLPAIPFEYCIRNFYRAAEKGLDAELIWPAPDQNEPRYFKVADILRELLPRVPEALTSAGFQEADFSPLLQVIQERLDSKQTGSQWQLKKLIELESEMPRPKALAEMLKQYQQFSRENVPVARWS